jgi:hypothetical protein
MSAAKTITRVPVPDLCCLWAEAPAAPHLDGRLPASRTSLTGARAGSVTRSITPGRYGGWT